MCCSLGQSSRSLTLSASGAECPHIQADACNPLSEALAIAGSACVTAGNLQFSSFSGRLPNAGCVDACIEHEYCSDCCLPTMIVAVVTGASPLINASLKSYV